MEWLDLIFGRHMLRMIPPEEGKFIFITASEVVAASFTTTTKTLIELGHEPFPLSMGKTLTGRNAYLLPNAFSYAKQLAMSHPLGWRVLMTGYDSGAFSIVTRRCTIRYGSKCFDDLFGVSPDENEEELDLDDGPSFWRALRWAIRDSMVCTVAVIASRPFRVVCIRQIAQVVGGEAKYFNFVGGLRVIIAEEGFRGLFVGLVPELCAELLLVWGCAAFTYVAERALTRIYTGGPKMGLMAALELPAYDYAEEAYKGTRKAIAILTPFFGSSILKSLFSASTVMACVGSGLAVSFLPYTPTFDNWRECCQYTYGRSRGFGLARFFREHSGAVVVGMNKQMYASNTP